MEEYLIHAGVAHDENPPGRGSGRYPYGSGKRKHQHSWDTLSRIDKLKSAGMSDKEIAKAMGWTMDKYNSETKKVEKEGNISRFRAEKEIAVHETNADLYDEVMWYRTHNDPKTGNPYTTSEIARLAGFKNESSLRSFEKSSKFSEESPIFKAAEEIKANISKTGYLDVGKGTNLYLDITDDRLKTVLAVLEKEGYQVVNDVNVKQLSGSDNYTTRKILVAPDKIGETDAETRRNIYQALKEQKVERFYDEQDKYMNAHKDPEQAHVDPVRIDPKRIEVRYAEQNGAAKDGMIEIRAVRDKDGNIVPACPDLSLGTKPNGEPNRYAQIRIAVDGGKELAGETNPTGGKYIKGMAYYNLDLPKGVDILVNSNKSESKGLAKALKDMDEGKDNPFGASTIQQWYTDKDGKRKLSAIQIVGATTMDDHDAHVEGRWGDWSKNLPAQFLSKQNLSLVKQQLKTDTIKREDELESIMSIKQPIVKRQLLLDFADGCDKAAEELKAAPFPGQKTHVLIASTTLKDTECYCANYDTGTTVALVRFPHTGPFEIPILKVNNRNKECQEMIGKTPLDAVCINKKTADKLSGADFDGDTAIVIPMSRRNPDGSFDKTVGIKAQKTLKELEDFDVNIYSTDNPRFAHMVKEDEYGHKHPTYPYPKTEKAKGTEMGKITNLITDMYAAGCDDPEELSRAVRYSMVIIDSKKHELNYKAAYQDYGIKELEKKYQMKDNGKSGGANSLISKASSEINVDKMEYRTGNIDPKTGQKIMTAPQKTTEIKRKPVYAEAPEGYTYTDKDGKTHKSKYFVDKDGNKVVATYTGKTVQNKDGTYRYEPGDGRQQWVDDKEVTRQMKTTRMANAFATGGNAYDLLSKNPSNIEIAYANYANHMNTIANEARKAAVSLETSYPKDPRAVKEYAKEVESLNQKLIKAKKNSVRERQAQALATSRVNAEMDANPGMYSDADDRKKLKDRALKQARYDCNAQKDRITFTDREWEAVENRAVSATTLSELLRNSDAQEYTSKAMPRTNTISSAKRSRIRTLAAQGYSQEEIAKMVDGVSTSSISNILSDKA